MICISVYCCSNIQKIFIFKLSLHIAAIVVWGTGSGIGLKDFSAKLLYPKTIGKLQKEQVLQLTCDSNHPH